MMNKLSVLVIGAGSIGQRHIENLLALGAEVSVFRYRSNMNSELTERYNVKVFNSIEDAFSRDYSAVVIANRPDQHVETAIKCAAKKTHLYIEKPLSNSIEGLRELQALTEKNGLIVEIGCMLRFHPNLTTIRRLLAEGAIGRPYIVRAFIGQYLPEWRPAADYRDSYSAKKAFGGGVLFDLIHELDYLYWLFGEAEEVSAFLDRVSDLEIDTEDIASINIRFRNRTAAQVQMDYLSPIYRRGCEITGSSGILTWDYTTGKVILRRKGEKDAEVFHQPESFERNTMFMDHMKHFLSAVKEGGRPAVSLKDGIRVLSMALAAHNSSENKKVVTPSEIYEC